MNRKHVYILLIALSLASLGGCYGRGLLVIPAETHRYSSTTIITHRGPPPHAPAHGYRYRHFDHDLRYDTGFGAYVVINSPGLYFYNDHYMRYYADSWQITNRLEGTWRPALGNDIPRKLKMAKHRDKDRYSKRHRRDNKHDNGHHREQHQAPQHGHRRHHNGHDLSYDSDIGAYIIDKRPGLYYYNDRYFRQYRGSWQSTHKLNGTWRAANRKEVPRKLRKNRKDKHNKHNKHDRNQYRGKWQ
ncbi:hypothetical protein JYT26_01275 [Beggiatoa alba]|nr:hypothetical protein [Beggiatoa alba]